MVTKLFVTTSILFSFLVSENNSSDSIKLKVFEISDSTITKGKKFWTVQPGEIDPGREIKFNNSNLAPEDVRIIFNDFFKKYIAIKEALVYKDSYGAGSKTLTLLEQMKSKSDEVNKDIKDARWDIFIHNYESIVKKVKANKFIAEQRFTFSEVSRGLENFIKQYGLNDKTIYLMQYRNDSLNINSSWMTDKKDFKNPYTGEINDTVYSRVKEVWVFE
ncbi:MAG: DUF3347 domain-containing protein [Ignavibacteria bacterium]